MRVSRLRRDDIAVGFAVREKVNALEDMTSVITNAKKHVDEHHIGAHIQVQLSDKLGDWDESRVSDNERKGSLPSKERISETTPSGDSDTHRPRAAITYLATRYTMNVRFDCEQTLMYFIFVCTLF